MGGEVSAKRDLEDAVAELAIEIVLLFAFPALVMVAWNYVMPVLWNGAPHIGYWHAFAINLLGGVIRSRRAS